MPSPRVAATGAAGSAQLSVLVVGCGNIAGRFDTTRPADALPLTHAGAYVRDGRFRLVGCVDPVLSARQEFLRHWEASSSHASLDAAAQELGHVDIVSICSPTAYHLRDVISALSLKPNLIFCEKPLAACLKDARALVAACEESGVLLAVNHTRRWDPDVIALKSALDSGEWGAMRSAIAFYNKGVLNNGSHMVDLLALYFGTLTIEETGSVTIDHTTEDPSVEAVLSCPSAFPIHLICGYARDFALFELELIAERRSIRMEEGGMRWRERPVADSTDFSGYRVLGQGFLRTGRYAEAMSRAVENIYSAVCENAMLASTGRSAILAQELCESLIARVSTGLNRPGNEPLVTNRRI